MRIVLRFGDEFASATLSDTPAAREFATMLPLQLKLRDPMGQAKSGSMPRQINAAGGEPVFNLTWWSLRMLGLRPLSSLALQVHLRS